MAEKISVRHFLLKACLWVALSLPTAPISAQFSGNVVLMPTGCERAGKCTSQESLRFVDHTGVQWLVPAGFVTDGASIPPIFQPIVGRPFDDRFIRAAIVHDYYCVKHVRTWPQTHRVFYEGLVAQNVDLIKAKLMYFAVVIGGPKWAELVPGTSCGPKCLFRFGISNDKSGSAGPSKRGTFVSRSADFSGSDLQDALNQLELELRANPTGISLDSLDIRARALRPDDFYFRNATRIPVNDLTQLR